MSATTADKVLDALRAFKLRKEPGDEFYGIIGGRNKRSRTVLVTPKRLLINHEGDIFMATSSNSTTLKRCSKCGVEKPLNSDNFPVDRARTDGYRPECRECRRAYLAEYQSQHGDVIREYQRNYYQANADKKRAYSRQWHKDTRDVRHTVARAWRQRNKEHLAASKRQYYLNNKDAEDTRIREWRKNNPDRLRVSRRRWNANNNAARRLQTVNRRAKRKALPDTFTVDQWQFALAYFNYCCAVCGRQLNSMLEDVTFSADHWIPLANAKCPGTVATNMVPLCHGAGGCNTSKNAQDPEAWLLRRFGKRRAKAISMRIQEYFALISEASGS